MHVTLIATKPCYRTAKKTNSVHKTKDAVVANCMAVVLRFPDKLACVMVALRHQL